MFMKKPHHKQFEYIPRYYDPKKDDDERRRRHFKFERNTHRGKNRPFIFVALLFIVVYLLYTYLH